MRCRAVSTAIPPRFILYIHIYLPSATGVYTHGSFVLDQDRYRPVNILAPPFLNLEPIHTWPDDRCHDLVPEGGDWLGLNKPQQLALIDLALIRDQLGGGGEGQRER